MKKVFDVIYNVVRFPYLLAKGIYWANIALVKAMWWHKGKTFVSLVIAVVIYLLLTNI